MKDKINRINSRAVPYDTVTPRRALREVWPTQQAADTTGSTTGSLGGMRVRRSLVRVTTTNPSAYCANGIPLDDPRSNGTEFRSDRGYRLNDRSVPIACQYQSSIHGPNGEYRPWAQEIDIVDSSAGTPYLLYQRLSNGTCPPIRGSSIESVRVGDFALYGGPFGNGCRYVDGMASYPLMSSTEFGQLVNKVYNFRANNLTQPTSSTLAPAPAPSTSRPSSTSQVASAPSTLLPSSSAQATSSLPTSSPLSTASSTLAGASAVAGSIAGSAGILATLSSFIAPTPTATIAASAPLLTVSTPALIVAGAAGLGALGGVGVAGYIAVRKYSANNTNNTDLPRAPEREPAVPSAPPLPDIRIGWASTDV